MTAGHWIAAAVLLLATGAFAAPATYYVATNGYDTSPGTQLKPWRTPGYASRKLKPGDTLIIRGGKYLLSKYDQDIVTPPSGAAGAWITIKGERGRRPILAGRNNLAMAVQLSGASFIRLENLEITHDDKALAAVRFFRVGIEAVGKPSSHLVLEDLYIHHVDEGGVNVQDVNNLRILNCRIEYCGFGAVGGPAGKKGGLRNVLVKGCSLSYSGHYYRGTDGRNRPYDRPDGFGIEASKGPVEIVDTTAEHNYGDGLDSKAADTYIHHCIVANNTCDGIKLWAGDSRIVNCLIYGTGDGDKYSPWTGVVLDDTTHANARFEVANCTVEDNPTRKGYPMYCRYDPSNNPITLVLVNNIVANSFGPVYVGKHVKVTAMNNCFWSPTQPVQFITGGTLAYFAADLNKSPLGPGNVSKNPRFVKSAWGTTGNYHLSDSSPCINKGADVGAPADDLEYNQRPIGAGVDMGAYER